MQPNPKWSSPKTNKAATTTTTKRTKLGNKAAEIKMQKGNHLLFSIM